MNAPKLEFQTFGILDGVSAENYHAIPAAHKSAFDKIERSPFHYKHHLDNPEPPTDAMVFGSTFHDALLLPAEFNQRYVVGQKFDRRTTVGKQAAAEFEAKNYGKTVVDLEDYADMQGMIASIKNHKEAMNHLVAGTSELSCFWKDEKLGTLCKCRPDLLLDSGTVVDIKTTQDASFKEFQRTVANFRYHVQAAFYMDGLKRFTNVDSFVFIAVEKKPPYAVAVYVLDDASIEKGREEYKRNLETYAHCMKTGEWPSHNADELTPMSLPAWSW